MVSFYGRRELDKSHLLNLHWIQFQDKKATGELFFSISLSLFSFFRVLRVDENLRMIGAESNIYGMGDCTYLTPQPLGNYIDWLYDVSK